MTELYKRSELDDVVNALEEQGYKQVRGAEYTHPELGTITLVGCGNECFVAHNVRQHILEERQLTKKAFLQLVDVDADKVINIIRQRTGSEYMTQDWYILEGGLIWVTVSRDTNIAGFTAFAGGETVKHMLSVAIMCKECYK